MTDKWHCGVCGESERNRADDKRCAHCGLVRGVYVCRWCGRRNNEHNKACRSCGQKKGTSPPEN